MAATWTTTKTGRQVVVGTPDEVHVGETLVDVGPPGFAPKLIPVTVASLGQPFRGPGGLTLVYGYLLHSRPQPTTAPQAPRASAGRPAARYVGNGRPYAPDGGRCAECGGQLDPRTQSGDHCFDCA
jgi:hypothetical protein